MPGHENRLAQPHVALEELLVTGAATDQYVATLGRAQLHLPYRLAEVVPQQATVVAKMVLDVVRAQNPEAAVG